MESPLIQSQPATRDAASSGTRRSLYPTVQPPSDPTALSPAWNWLERHFQRAYDIRPLAAHPGCLLAYNRFRYQGPELELPGGVRIHSGDPMLEVHFRREALLPLAGLDPARVAIQMLKMADRDFPQLARLLETDGELRDVRALHALTLFHGAAERYGFQVRPIRERHLEWWFTSWQRLLLTRDHRAGGAQARKLGAGLTARHIWLPREALIRRCAERAERGRTRALSGSAR